MIWEAEKKTVITRRTTISTLHQNENLSLIEAYLSERLAKECGIGVSAHKTFAMIDLGILAASDVEKKFEQWKHADIIYTIRLDSSTVILGPVYRPSKAGGPCPICLERRRLALRCNAEHHFSDLQQVLTLRQNPLIGSFALEAIWTVVEAMLHQTYQGTEARGEDNQVYALELGTLRLARYQLIADSLCPVCSAPRPDSFEAARIQLSSRIKRNVSEYRLVSAATCKLPLEKYVNPICGMLGNRAFPDYTHPVNTLVKGTFTETNKYFPHDVHWVGKGDTYSAGLPVGLLEGLERYAGLKPRAKKTMVFDSYENLQPNALNPVECGLYPQESYSLSGDNFLTPFSPNLNIPWVWAYSFRYARPLLVPECIAYYSAHRLNYPILVYETSNGCASGSTLEEAILFGLLELVERDGFLLTWYAKLEPCRIDPRSCRSSRILSLLDRINRLGYEVHILDARYDMPIPSVIAVGVLPNLELGTLIVSAGASLDARDTIESALKELGSHAFFMLERMQRGLDPIRLKAQDYSKVIAMEDHGTLYGLPEMAEKASFLYRNPNLRSFEESYAGWLNIQPRNHDLRDDLTFCIDLVLRMGLDVIVVEQTSPEQERAGFKTVKVIVPGLLPIGFGWHHVRVKDLPRLRSAPRVAGYLDTDFDTTHCNADPHPFY